MRKNQRSQLGLHTSCRPTHGGTIEYDAVCSALIVVLSGRDLHLELRTSDAPAHAVEMLRTKITIDPRLDQKAWMQKSSGAAR